MARRRDVDRWSPEAEPGATAMTPTGDGCGLGAGPLARGDATAWCDARLRRAAGCADYAFRSTAATALPDPRSAWQPHGVHGPSRVFDPPASPGPTAAGAGRVGAGVLGAVVYELHVGTFTPEGTLDAAVDRLDHLVDLGVDVVELMPVAAFPGRTAGATTGSTSGGARRLRRPGGAAALRRRLPRPRASASASTSSTTTSARPATTSREFGPYFTDRAPDAVGRRRSTSTAPGSDEVRRCVIDNALRWFRDFHVDALRLDAVHELSDDSPRALLARAVRRGGRPGHRSSAGR